MRSAITLVILGTVLSGCLIEQEPNNLTETDPTSNDEFPGDNGSGGGTTANSAPTIGGSPSGAVTTDNTYDFSPTASDDDGDRLTFSIQNKPLWATFDSSSGRLSGRPTVADVGSYNQIVISVTDGTDMASLNAFSVDVVQTALGSVTLSWDAPQQNEDGSPLMDLSGYKIYYGDASRSYDNEVQIDGVGQTMHVIEDLVPGTYYFAATAFNSAGVESDFSGEAVRQVN